MTNYLYKHELKTNRREEFLDISSIVTDDLRQSGIQDGLCVIFVPHTTAAITINENADPEVKRDITVKLRELIPKNGDYHHLEGNSDAHLKASLIGFSETLIFAKNELQLGLWQSIYFAEFDGPRKRHFLIKIIAG